MAPIASPPPFYLSQLSGYKIEGGASDSMQEESDGARCLPPPTPSIIGDRRRARFRDCELRKPYTPFIRKFWDSPCSSEDSVVDEDSVVVTSASAVTTSVTTPTTTNPQATSTNTTASPVCLPRLSDSVGGEVFGGPQEIVPQSSDQVLKGKGLFRRLKVWGRGSQKETTPRHAVPFGENLRARLDFSNESLLPTGDQAPVLSPGGDPVMSGDNPATGAEGSDRPPVREPLSAESQTEGVW